MRKSILGPVVLFFLVVGLIGTDFGQTAQAKTDKAGTKAVAAKETKQDKEAAGSGQAVVQSNKTSSHKKKDKVASAGRSKHKKKVSEAAGPKASHGKKSGITAANKHKAAEAKGTRVARKGKHPDTSTKNLKLANSRKHKSADDRDLKVAKGKKHKDDARKNLKTADGKNPDGSRKTLKAAERGRHKDARNLKVADRKKHGKDKNRKDHAIARNRSRRHSHENIHARSPERTRTQVKVAQSFTAPDYQIHTPKPSDLYLSKQDPDSMNPLAQDSDADKPVSLSRRVLNVAYKCLGIPYRHGGTTTAGFDCSGFVKYVFKENGIELARSSRDQALDGKQVSLSEIRPGDLIFFRMHQRRSNIDHVGLYVGNGQFIHASSGPRGHEIKVDSIETGHYLQRFVEARRVLDEDQQADASMAD
jgi:cell wall-associated NlpC family hydrolase